MVVGRGMPRHRRRRPARLAARRRRVLLRARARAARACRTRALIGVDGLAATADELRLLRAGGRRAPVALPLAPWPGVRQRRDGRRARPGVAARCRTRSRSRRSRAAGSGRTAGCSPRSPRSCPTRGRRSRPTARSWPRLAGAAPGAACRRAGGAASSPGPSPLVRRADLVGVGTDDFERGTPLEELAAFVGPGDTLLVTDGARGGTVIVTGARRPVADPRRLGARSRSRTSWTRRAPATRSSRASSPPGSSRRCSATRVGDDLDLRFGAAAASLVCEGPGLRRGATTGRRPRAPATRVPVTARPTRLAAPRVAAGVPRAVRPRRSRSASSRGWGRPVSRGALEQPPRRPGRGERALRVAEAVLAQLRDLDPGDRAQRAARRGRASATPPPTPPSGRAGAARAPAPRRARSSVQRERVPGRRPRAPGRATRPGRSPARRASRHAAAASAEVRPASGRPPGVASARPARGAAAAATATARTGRASGARRGDRVVQALERLVVAPLARVRPRQAGEVAARRLVAGRRARRSDRSTCASSSPSERTSFSLWITTPGERVDRAAPQHVEVDRRDLPALDVADPADAQQLALDRAQPGVVHPVRNTRRTNGSRSRCPAWSGRGPTRPAGTGPRSAASRSRGRCSVTSQRLGRDPAGDLGEQRRLVGVVREEQLGLAEAASLPPREPDEERERAGRRREPGRLRVEADQRRVRRAGARGGGRGARDRPGCRAARRPGARAGRPGASATSAPSAVARRAASGRAPAARERGPRRAPGRAAGAPRPAGERRSQVREPPLARDRPCRRRARRSRDRRGPTGRRLARAAPAPSAGEQAQRERLAVDLGLEARARCTPGSRPRTGRPGSGPRPRRPARRGARTAAPRARRRRASPRTGRSSAPRGAASGPGTRGRGPAGRPSAARPRPPGSPARRRSARRPARPAASRSRHAPRR